MKFIRVPLIVNKKTHSEALKFQNKILSAPAPLVHAVAAVIEDYEKRHYPISPPQPIEALKFRLDQLGWRIGQRGWNAFIHHKTGIQRGRISELISGARGMSKDMIARLHYGLGIPLESLIGPNPIKKSCLRD